MRQGSAIREVVLNRDVRAPETLSALTASPGYLARRYTSITALMLIDVLGLLAAAALVDFVAARGRLGSVSFSPPLLLALAAALVAVFATNHLYGLREARRLRRRRLRATAWFVALALLASAVAFVPPQAALAASLLAIAFLAVGRELFDFCLRVLFGLQSESRRTILVGSERACHELAGYGPRYGHATILGLVGAVEYPSPCAEGSIPALGTIDNMDSVAELWRPDEIIVVDKDFERDHLSDLAAVCRRRRITLRLTDLEMRFEAAGVCLIPNLDEALFVAAPSAPSGVAWVIKRCGDLAVAATGLIVLAPLMALVALTVKLTSPGPVFYSAERIGLGQRRFRCHKFRTMRDGADIQQNELEAENEADGAMFKIRDDPRLTRVGRWLRRTSIDELPQLFNVLRGEMSLVGPRPLPLRDNTLLDSWHRQRHVVLPGLTGLWQVSGRSDASFDEMMRLDLHYVDNWSLWLDFSIAWRTLKVMLDGSGAY
jgi:exopolysaccharide biosynthesis polyprenyl glycosylphosphotransferase